MQRKKQAQYEQNLPYFDQLPVNTKESQILELIIFLLERFDSRSLEEVLSQIEGYQLDLTEA